MSLDNLLLPETRGIVLPTLHTQAPFLQAGCLIEACGDDPVQSCCFDERLCYCLFQDYWNPPFYQEGIHDSPEPINLTGLLHLPLPARKGKGQ